MMSILEGPTDMLGGDRLPSLTSQQVFTAVEMLCHKGYLTPILKDFGSDTTFGLTNKGETSP